MVDNVNCAILREPIINFSWFLFCVILHCTIYTHRWTWVYYPYPQSGALTIYDCMRPALRNGCGVLNLFWIKWREEGVKQIQDNFRSFQANKGHFLTLIDPLPYVVTKFLGGGFRGAFSSAAEQFFVVEELKTVNKL